MKRIIAAKNIYFVLTTLFLFSSCKKKIEESDSTTNIEQPNIVLIMGDDIGFSDLSCYGSEISTPNIDKLADEGIRFGQFYNMSKCETTRSVMLTGRYYGNKQVRGVSELLRDAGYFTIQCGKEHFKNSVPDNVYAKNSMDRSLVFWAINEFFIPPSGELANPFYLNGKKLKDNELMFNGDQFYKTDALVDYALGFLDEAQKEKKPFFLYLPFHVAHYPLQALPEDIEKFKGKYKKGWDSIRENRFSRQKEMGFFDDSTALSPGSDNINKFRGHPKGDDEIREKIPLFRSWDGLTEKEKDDMDLEMAVFAAMVHRMDANIGRVIEWLEKNNQRENTLVIYLSDNGSCPYDSNKNFDIPPGGADSYRTLSAAWASTGNTPFRYFKQYGHEGGTRTHMIASWPKQIKEVGSINKQPGHLIDFYPTFLEMAGISYPDSLLPLQGSSLMPVFKGEVREEPEFIMSGFQDNFRMFRQGDWKIVKVNNEPWELYDLINDPTELKNRADGEPERLNKMSKNYEEVRNDWRKVEGK